MNILLGVSGGIAAYKAIELVRELQHRGITVQVAMTAGAEEFVRPLTFATLTGRQVLTTLWLPTTPVEGTQDPFSIEHIDIAQSIDALVIAPATANTLARLAHGHADDVLTTVHLATHAPVLLAPAMNVNMWHHPATQANLALLRSRGVHIVEPSSGELACGMVGPGRLAPVTTIADQVYRILEQTKDLAAETILITAGGTREPIDPVRFLGNRSSGKMGHALAEAAAQRGAKVILITASPLPAHACEIIPATTARAMRQAVMQHLPQATIVIAAAAVADYRAREVAPQKLKRTGPLTLTLEPTEDIVAEVVNSRQPNTLVIAFAAETENLLANARAKQQRKGVDAIIANDVSHPHQGFESDHNAGHFLTPTTCHDFPPSTKPQMAQAILDQILTLRPAVPKTQPPSF